jgi:hypothetical protein
MKMDKVIAVIKNDFESMNVVDYGSSDFLEVKYMNTVWAIKKTDNLDEMLKAYFVAAEVAEYPQSFYEIKAA